MPNKASLVAKSYFNSFLVDNEWTDRQYICYVFPFVILPSESLSFVCCNPGPINL